MYFKLLFNVQRLDIRTQRPFRCEFGNKEGIVVEVRAPTEEEKSQGYKSFNATGVVTGSIRPTRKSLPVFDAVERGMLPPENQKAKTVEELTRTTGPMVGLENFPPPFCSFVNKTNDLLSDYAQKTVSVVRWRHAQKGPHSPLSIRGLHWSRDSDHWMSLPGSYSIQSITPKSSVLLEKCLNSTEIVRMVAEGLTEPFSHELLREAEALRFSSPRSSLLVAISALEIGLKSVIKELVPHSEWMVDNLQAPSVERMLVQYIQRMPVRNTFGDRPFVPPKSLLDSIRKGIAIRNNLVHKESPPPTRETLDEVILAVQDMLWIFDFFVGHEWASEHIRRSVSEEIFDE